MRGFGRPSGNARWANGWRPLNRLTAVVAEDALVAEVWQRPLASGLELEARDDGQGPTRWAGRGEWAGMAQCHLFFCSFFWVVFIEKFPMRHFSSGD